jgi:hypothetical protein
MPFGGDIGEKDAHLTILHLSGGSAILHPDACRLLPLFWKTRFVDDYNGGRVAKMLKGVSAQIIAHAIGIPDGAGEQPLHPIRASLSGVFSQLPAVFARRVTQDALEVGQRPATWLRSGKTGSNAGMQMGKLLGPTANIGGGRSDFGVCGKLVLLHLLLLLDGPLGIAVVYLQSVTSERRRTWSSSSAFQAFMAGLTSATVVFATSDHSSP